MAEQEGVFGRRKADSVELADDVKPGDAHIARVVIEEGGRELEIYRRSVPYGTVAEHGLFFLAFSADPGRFDRMLGAMYGVEDGVRDRITEFTTPLSGAYYFAPSVSDLDDALGCDVVTCVTPGAEPVLRDRDVRPGAHLNMLGADGPGKAEAEPAAVAKCRLFCDEWEQASHGGEMTGAVERGLVARERVTELGDVLTGAAPGRSAPEAATLFDSTGLAIQDLAVCRALLEAHRAGAVSPGRVRL